jgi:hypothetical protein
MVVADGIYWRWMMFRVWDIENLRYSYGDLRRLVYGEYIRNYWLHLLGSLVLFLGVYMFPKSWLISDSMFVCIFYIYQTQNNLSWPFSVVMLLDFLVGAAWSWRAVAKHRMGMAAELLWFSSILN